MSDKKVTLHPVFSVASTTTIQAVKKSVKAVPDFSAVTQITMQAARKSVILTPDYSAVILTTITKGTRRVALTRECSEVITTTMPTAKAQAQVTPVYLVVTTILIRKVVMWQLVFTALTTAPRCGLYADSATSHSAKTYSAEHS